MATLVSIIVHLAAICVLASKVLSVTMQPTRLVGDSNNYINLRSSISYTLICSFRAGYDDPVTTVTWLKNGIPVYQWKEGDTFATAFRSLSGRVFTTEKPELKNIYFNNRLSFDLSGNYTCEVASRKETVQSNPYNLVILDVPSDDFVSNVTLLSEVPEETEVSPEEKEGNCTLLWDFQTPAIFPRPNVTCGYYSYLHDDVTSQLPAGLGMHLLNNGSWQAGFEHTHIQIADIPREKRLGCSVSVPDTSFKRVIKFEDNFAIDHLIDSEGCPAMFLDSIYRLMFTIEGGEMNCRGDLVPSSDEDPLNIKIRCSPGDMAVFRNGTAVLYWSMEMTCDSMDFVWRRTREGAMLPEELDIENEVPLCMPNGNSGPKTDFSFILMTFLPSLLALHCWLYFVAPRAR